ncbi:MAG: hypothetical protein V1858_03650 [Candidatus Gottesmanbacteria bacterium]
MIIKMRKIIFVLFLISCSFTISPQGVHAKKSLVGRVSYSSKLGPIISPKLRSDRLALIISFSGLYRTSSVSYTLSYNTNGLPQGVMGTIKPVTDSTQRELLFGTCSSSTCRYHINITNMRLVITSYLKSGGRVVKSYRVKP